MCYKSVGYKPFSCDTSDRNFHIEDFFHRQFNIEVQFVKSVNYTFEQSL